MYGLGFYLLEEDRSRKEIPRGPRQTNIEQKPDKISSNLAANSLDNEIDLFNYMLHTNMPSFGVLNFYKKLNIREYVVSIETEAAIFIEEFSTTLNFGICAEFGCEHLCSGVFFFWQIFIYLLI